MIDPRLPLSDVRIVDLTQFEAGPSATQILAFLGADVIKVEPPRGEPGRALQGASEDRDSIFFALFNQSKRSVVLDLTRETDRSRLESLLASADVLTENFAPGTLERLGLDPERLALDHPRLVVASVRGYRSGGPWSDYKSLDMVAQAVGGGMSVTGERGREPVRMGATVADSGAGLHLAIGILSALHRRARDGAGGRVEVALQDVIVNSMRTSLQPTYLNGNPAERTGSEYAWAAPSGLHPCAPGGPNDYIYVLLSSNRQWDGILRAIGREELIGDERYARQSRRNAAHAEVREILGAWTRERDKIQVMEALSDQGVPCGAVLDTRELLANEHLRAVDMIVEQEVPGWGRIPLPACPIRIDGPPPRLEPPPALGADIDLLKGE